jgi:hypothetical protein
MPLPETQSPSTRVFIVVMSTIKSILRFLYVVVAMFGLLSIVGGFSDRQAIVLSLMSLVVYIVAERKFKTPALSPALFTPFSATICPNWDALLKDGLITPEGIQKARSAQNPTGFNVLTHGISFTVLSTKLIYFDNHHSFVPFSALSHGIREPLEEFSHDAIYARFWIDDKKPHSKGLGLEIGVRTPETHRKGIDNYMPDSDLMPLATLPPEVFRYNWFPQDFDHGGPRSKEHFDRLKSRLSELGWNLQDRPLEIPGPEVYEHKYVEVYVRDIS